MQRPRGGGTSRLGRGVFILPRTMQLVAQVLDARLGMSKLALDIFPRRRL
jgi:hypothetical protein